jgi:hypothetical protein
MVVSGQLHTPVHLTEGKGTLVAIERDALTTIFFMVSIPLW